MRRHISLSFWPPERNTFHLKRIVDLETKISFVVIHDPPIGRKENVVGTLHLEPSYYFRPAGSLTFTWEINRPLRLIQVLQEEALRICCILKDPTRDTRDYAAGKKSLTSEELVKQQRAEVLNGY